MLDTIPFIRLAQSKKHKSLNPEIAFAGIAILSLIAWKNLSDFSSLVLLFIWYVALALLIGLTVSNFRTMLLPNSLTRPLALTALVYQVVNSLVAHDGGILLSALLGGLVLGGVPYIVFQISAGRWIGGGDVKLAFGIGILLGLKLSLLCIAVMLLLLGLVFLISYIEEGKKSPSSKASRTETGILWTSAATICFLLGQRFL